MAFAREAAHVEADFGNDNLGAELADTGDRAQDFDRRSPSDRLTRLHR